LGEVGTVRDLTLETELVLALLSTDAVLSRRGVADEARERERRVEELSLGEVGIVNLRAEAGALTADQDERGVLEAEGGARERGAVMGRGAVRVDPKREKVGVADESAADEGRAFLAEWRRGVFEVETRPRLPMVPDDISASTLRGNKTTRVSTW
jgi:hypothetical protein